METLAAIPTAAPSASGIPGKIPEMGRYTVEFPDGGWKTLRFKRAERGGLAGKVIASYLAGPDNESDYIGFANSNDGEATMRVWNRFKSDTWLVEALRVVLRNDEGAAKAGLAYAMKSGRCYRCGRPLTVPTSIHRGLGPDCAGKQ